MSKLVDAVNQMITWSFMNIKGQGHTLTFVQGHTHSTFSNFFPLETPRPTEAKSYALRWAIQDQWSSGFVMWLIFSHLKLLLNKG